MTSALNKYVFSCLPAAKAAAEKHNPEGKDRVHGAKAAAGATKAATKPKATNNPEGKDRVRGDNPDSPGRTGGTRHDRDIKLEADTQVKLIEKHERDIKDKPPNEQISGFDIPDGASADADALYEKISTYEFPMERYYLNTKDARRRETLATTCRLSNQKITSALNGLIRGRI